MPSRASCTGGRTIERESEVFVAFDVAKKKHAIAIAEGGRTGQGRFLGDVENTRCRSSGRSRDRQVDTSGCMSALKLTTSRGTSPDPSARPRMHGCRSGSDSETVC